MKVILVIMLMSLINTPVLCAVTIIGKVGPTVSISHYLDVIEGAKKTQPMFSSKKMASANFSVKTDSLSPGIVKERTVHATLLGRPIFLVGDDEFSKKWLSKFADRLNKIHAVGFIVNTVGSEETKALENIFHVVLIPVNASELGKRFHITHYPVLISKNRIEQ